MTHKQDTAYCKKSDARWQWLELRTTVLPGTRPSLFLIYATKQDNTVKVKSGNQQIKHKE